MTAFSSTTPSELTVRQHQRLSCDLVAHVRVSAEDAAQVALSRTVGDGAGCITARVVDCSSGGLGVQMGVFLPRGARLSVSVHDPADKGATLFAGTGRVQRVQMLDRGPTFYLGVAVTRDGGAGDLSSVVQRAQQQFEKTASPIPPSTAPPSGGAIGGGRA